MENPEIGDVIPGCRGVRKARRCHADDVDIRVAPGCGARLTLSMQR
jgi:hypothetical protein